MSEKTAQDFRLTGVNAGPGPSDGGGAVVDLDHPNK